MTESSARMRRIVRKHRYNYWLRRGVVLVAVILVLLILYGLGRHLYTAYQYFSWQPKAVQPQTVTLTVSGPALVLQKEQIYLAPFAGRYENIVKDGERVSKGTAVGQMVNGQNVTAIEAEQSGIYCARMSGWEKPLADININAVTDEIFSYKTQNQPGTGARLAGQPLFKLVDNLFPTCLLIKCGDERLLTIGQTVNLLMEDKSELGNGKIVGLAPGVEGQYVLVEMPNFCEKLLNHYKFSAILELGQEIGYEIPLNSMVEIDDKKGVYCLNGETISFKNVTIIEENEVNLIVTGLDDDTTIISNPRGITRIKG